MTTKKPRISDDELLAAWRTASDERVPGQLDREVRAQAATRRGRWFAASRWTPGLAFAAALLLAVAVVFESPPGTTISDTPPEHDNGVSPPATTAPAPRRLQQAPLQEDLRQRRDAPVAEEFDATIRDSMPKLERRERAAGKPAAAASEATVDNGHGAEQDSAACSESEQRSADSWWTCVAGLRAAGERQAAERELASLLTAFPDFVPPDSTH